MNNPVVFVSLGPGDPELVTLKAWKTLQAADIICCPSVPMKDGTTLSRACALLLELGIARERIHLFPVPMQKDRTDATERYRKVAGDIYGMQQRGSNVVVVAEGDAGFYSSVQYIWEELITRQIPLIRIPGVPAFIACGALAGLHIVRQEEELDILPGIVTGADMESRLRQGRVVVIIKPSQSERVIKELLDRMPEVTFHYFENVGVAGKEYYTTDRKAISSRTFPYFSLFIIRK